MENLEGPIGAISITFFREGLKEDTTLALIVSRPSVSAASGGSLMSRQASEDIGRVAAGVFAVSARVGCGWT